MSGKSKKSTNFLKGKEDVIQEKSYITKEVETSITLLESPENYIVLDALLFISRYGCMKIENLMYLQRHGVLPKLFKLLDRNICILRVSLKLLGIVLSLPEAIAEIDQDIYDEKILEITDMYITTKDEYLKEYSMSILSKLVQCNRIFTLIFKVDLFTPVFETLDIGIKDSLLLDTLNFLYSLIESPGALSILPDLKCFKPELILKHLENPIVDIQSIVMEIIRKLTSYKLDVLQKMFREAKLIEKIFEIIMDPSWYLQHQKALSILSFSLNSDETNTYFVDTLEFLKFCQWVKTCESPYLQMSSEVFYKLSKKPSLRQLLFDLSVEDSILMFFRSKDRKVLSNACKAVSNMTEHPYCCEKMLTPILFKLLLGLLSSRDDTNDPESEIPFKTIHDFGIRSFIKTVEMFVQFEGLPILLKRLKDYSKLSTEGFIQVLNVLNMVSVHPTCKEEISNTFFYMEILKHLENENVDIVKISAEILTNFVVLESFRDYFLEQNLAEYTLDLIVRSKCTPLIKSLLVFIHNLMVYIPITEAFLHAKIIKIFRNTSVHIRENLPLMDRIMNLVFELYLPIKFYELGYLHVRDKIIDKFYIVTGHWKFPFPFLEIFEAQEKCPINTVYLIDYSYKSNSFDSKTSSSTSFGSSTTESLSSTFSSCIVNFGHISADPYLPRYISDIYKFLFEETCFEHKIRILAEFVETIMCGPKEDLDLNQKLHQFKLHIQLLKEKLGSNIIPIGYLRMGFHCERALLFKAIADKIDIPTSLHRGRNNVYWNEVVLTGGFDGELCDKLEVFVVDLMEDVGKLLPKNSNEANAYCRIYF